jgi:hypothetical protein
MSTYCVENSLTVALNIFAKTLRCRNGATLIEEKNKFFDVGTNVTIGTFCCTCKDKDFVWFQLRSKNVPGISLSSALLYQCYVQRENFEFIEQHFQQTKQCGIDKDNNVASSACCVTTYTNNIYSSAKDSAECSFENVAFLHTTTDGNPTTCDGAEPSASFRNMRDNCVVLTNLWGANDHELTKAGRDKRYKSIKCIQEGKIDFDMVSNTPSDEREKPTGITNCSVMEAPKKMNDSRSHLIESVCLRSVNDSSIRRSTEQVVEEKKPTESDDCTHLTDLTEVILQNTTEDYTDHKWFSDSDEDDNETRKAFLKFCSSMSRKSNDVLKKTTEHNVGTVKEQTTTKVDESQLLSTAIERNVISHSASKRNVEIIDITDSIDEDNEYYEDTQTTATIDNSDSVDDVLPKTLVNVVQNGSKSVRCSNKQNISYCINTSTIMQPKVSKNVAGVLGVLQPMVSFAQGQAGSSRMDDRKTNSAKNLRSTNKFAPLGAVPNEFDYMAYSRTMMWSTSIMTAKIGYIPITYDFVEALDRQQNNKRPNLPWNGTDDRCPLCWCVFDIGDNVSYNVACGKNIRHYLCETCTKEWCLRVPRIDCYQKNNSIMICPNECQLCRARGPFVKTSFGSNQSKQGWKYEEEVCKSGQLKIEGTHQRRNKFCNWIVDLNLLLAIQVKEPPANNHGFTEETVDSRSLTGSEKNRYEKYIEMTTKKFTCYKCRLLVRNPECCMVKECKNSCKYKLCVLCFAEVIVTKHRTKSRPQYFSGLLRCPLCKVTGAGWNPIAKTIWCKGRKA